MGLISLFAMYLEVAQSHPVVAQEQLNIRDRLLIYGRTGVDAALPLDVHNWWPGRKQWSQICDPKRQ